MEVHVDLSRQHAGHVLAVQRHRRPGGRPQLRDRVPRHQGHAVPARQRLRGRARVITPNEFPARTPVDRTMEKGYRTGAKAADRAEEGNGKIRDRRPRPQLPRLRATAGKTCNCDIEFGHRDTTAALIAQHRPQDEAYLEWDAKTERFTNNEAANKLLTL